MKADSQLDVIFGSMFAIKGAGFVEEICIEFLIENINCLLAV